MSASTATIYLITGATRGLGQYPLSYCNLEFVRLFNRNRSVPRRRCRVQRPIFHYLCRRARSFGFRRFQIERSSCEVPREGRSCQVHLWGQRRKRSIGNGNRCKVWSCGYYYRQCWCVVAHPLSTHLHYWCWLNSVGSWWLAISNCIAKIHEVPIQEYSEHFSVCATFLCTILPNF